MNCKKCKGKLRKVGVAVEGTRKKVDSYQCGRCNYFFFNKKSSKKMLKELQQSIQCDCGALLEPKQARFEGFETEAMVCPRCGFTTITITKEQAQQYVKLKQMHSVVGAE